MNIIRHIEGILEKDKEYVLMPKMYSPDLNVVNMFTFGRYTKEKILEITFECQRCGECCVERIDHNCKNLTNDNICSIHQQDTYPLQCKTFPFVLNKELVSEGIGHKITGLFDVRYNFGITYGIMLLIDPADRGFFKGNKTLGDIFEEVKQEYLEFDDKNISPDDLEKEGTSDFFRILEDVREELMKDK